MKKLIALLTIVGFMTFGISNLFAQEEQAQPEEAATEQVAETVAPAVESHISRKELPPLGEG